MGLLITWRHGFLSPVRPRQRARRGGPSTRTSRPARKVPWTEGPSLQSGKALTRGFQVAAEMPTTPTSWGSPGAATPHGAHLVNSTAGRRRRRQGRAAGTTASVAGAPSPAGWPTLPVGRPVQQEPRTTPGEASAQRGRPKRQVRADTRQPAAGCHRGLAGSETKVPSDLRLWCCPGEGGCRPRLWFCPGRV